MSYPVKIQPECRYGHGPLQEEVLDPSPEGEDRGLAIPSFALNRAMRALIPDGGGFTVKPYKCPKCGYMEFFDGDD